MKARSYLTLLLLLLGVTAWGQTTYKLEQVTSVESLVADAMYVFEQDGYVMNNTIKSNALQTTKTYKTTGLNGSESYVWTLESASGGFYLKNKKNEKYLTNTSSTSVSFQEQEDCSVWVFNFQSDKTVLIQNKSNGDRFLGYTSSTSHAYRAYVTDNSSTYPHAINVYKLVEVSVPNFTVTFDQPETVFAETFNVTLTASPEDADIYYTLNGSTPTTTGSTLYNPEEGITLNATATIKAVAAVNGVAGAVATATYQKNEPVAESLGDIFRRVSNVSTLRDGDQIIIVNEDYSKVLDKENGTSSGNSRKADDCDINGETIQMEDNNKILTLKKDGNGWILYTDDANFLYSESSNKNNYLKITSAINGLNSNQYVASISIENNNAKIAYCGGERWIMYNDGYDIFSCYKGTQNPVQIYRKESVDAITLKESSTDNGTIISNAASQGKVLSVNLYRQLTANMWNTICLPFDMDDAKMTELFGKGYKLRYFSGVEKDGGDVTLMFAKATTLQAGVPYIVLPTKTVECNAVAVVSNVKLTSTQPEVVTKTADGKEYTFQGIYAPTSFEANDKTIRFVGANNMFYYPSNTNPMRAFRAYFTLPKGATTAKVGMSFDEDMGVATGIVAVDGGAMDGRIYSMSGQYVGTSTQGLPRGLYIRDGRKFVVK